MPSHLDLRQQEAFPSSRATCLSLLEFQSDTVRLESLQALELLFAYDPLTSHTAVDLPKLLEEMTELVERADRYTTPVQRALVDTYALGIESLVSHTARGNFRGIASSVKERLKAAPGLLDALNSSVGEPDQLLTLSIACASEGAKRLGSDEKPTSLMTGVLDLIQLGVAVGVQDAEATWSKLVELFDRAKSHLDSRKQGWYEGVVLLRGLSRQMLSYAPPHRSDGITPYDRFQAFLIEQSEQKRRRGVNAVTRKKVCQWQIFVAAARELQTLATHYSHGATQELLHRRFLSEALEDPGLLALLSLRKVLSASNYPQVELGVTQVVLDMLTHPPESLSSKNQSLFEKDLVSFMARLKDDSMRHRLQSEGRHLHRAWEEQAAESKRALAAERRKVEQAAQHLQAAQPSAPPAEQEELKHEIEAHQHEAQALAEAERRLEQITEDFALALRLQASHEQEMKTKQVWSPSDTSLGSLAGSEASAATATATSTGRLASSTSLLSTSSTEDLLPEECYDMFGLLMEDAVFTPSGNTYSERGILKWIHEQGTDPNTREPLTPAQLYPNRMLRGQIAQLKENFNLSSERSFAPERHGSHAQLYHAVRRGQLDKMQKALAKGAHPTQFKDHKTGDTALHAAVRHADGRLTEQMVLLLTERAQIDVKNKAGETPFLIACGHSRAAAEVLMGRGVDRETKGPTGGALHYASTSGQLELCDYLVDLGFEVSSLCPKKTTPLMRACSLGHTPIVELFLESGANVDLEDAEGNTAYMYAAKHKHQAIMDLLLEWGAEPKQVDAASQPVQVSQARAPAVTVQRLAEPPSRPPQPGASTASSSVEQKPVSLSRPSLPPRSSRVSSHPKGVVAPTVTLSAATATNLPSIAFGAVNWRKYFGDVGEEPPIPADIFASLKAECPFWPGKRVEETHLLTLIPATVDDKPFCLDLLGDLIQHPKTGHATKYEYCWDKLKAQLGQQSPDKSYWVLMSRDVLEGTRAKSYKDQCAVLDSKRQGQPYEVPGVLEAATGILMEHVHSGAKLFGREPWTYTRCWEKIGDYQGAVGGFGAAGLGILFSNRIGDGVGLAPARKF